MSRLRAGPGLPRGLRLTIIEDGPLVSQTPAAPAPPTPLELAAAVEDRLARRLLSIVYDSDAPGTGSSPREALDGGS